MPILGAGFQSCVTSGGSLGMAQAPSENLDEGPGLLGEGAWFSSCATQHCMTNIVVPKLEVTSTWASHISTG